MSNAEYWPTTAEDVRGSARYRKTVRRYGMTIRQSSGACTPSFSSAELGRLACPKCGGALRVEWKLETTGPAMVAGVTLKIGAKYAPHLTCDECGFTEAGVRSNAAISGAQHPID